MFQFLNGLSFTNKKVNQMALSATANKMEKPKVTNDWITLAEQRNGLTVQRKFAD